MYYTIDINNPSDTRILFQLLTCLLDMETERV